MTFMTKSYRKHILVAGIGLIGLLAGGQAMAANPATSTMTVDAIVDNVCIVDSASAIHFGNLNSIEGTSTSPTANTKNGSGDVNYACTNGSSPVVYLSDATTNLAGTASGNTGTNILATYTESDFTTAFPTTSGAGDSLIGDGGTHAVTIYGVVATTTATVADTYSGTVTVNIAY